MATDNEKEENLDIKEYTKAQEAKDILKEMGELAKQFALVSVALAREQTKEAAQKGKENLSNTIDELTENTVGSIKENSKLHEQYKEHKSTLLGQYNKTVDLIKGRYSRKEEQLVTERMELLLDNKNKKVEKLNIWIDKKKAEKSQTKKKIMQSPKMFIEITNAKKQLMEAAKSGDKDKYEIAKQQYDDIMKSHAEKTGKSVDKVFEKSVEMRNKQAEIDKNNKRIKEIDEEIEKLAQEKQEKLEKAGQVKNKGITKMKKQNPIMKRITMFMSRFAINRGRQLRDNVYNPLSEVIKENFDQAKEGIGNKIEDAKEFGSNAKEFGKEKINKGKESFRDKITKIEQGTLNKGWNAVNKLNNTLSNAQEKLNQKTQQNQKEDKEQEDLEQE